MCLRAEGIDDNNGGVGRVRRAKGLSDDDVGVGIVRGIRDVSEGSETTAEAAGDRRRAQGIYGNNRGVRGGKCTRRLQQQQRMHQRRIDDAFKGLKTTTESAAD